MAKNNRPEIDNPLASMGLDDIVRNITATGSSMETDKKGTDEDDGITKKTRKPRRGRMKTFEENLAKYTGINERGIAIWLPKEVKKKLEIIRVNANRNIPLRSLAAAIIMTYVAENENKLNEL